MARRRRDWGSIREWLNVAVAVGTLLIGVVSFWTTARISGLEDYLRSEISRRNEELNSLASRSDVLERAANTRSSLLAQLQTSTDDLLKDAVVRAAQLQLAQFELSRVRQEVLSARLNLSDTLRRQNQLALNFQAQSENYELFKRRQTYQSATILMSLQSVYDGEDGDGFTGKEAQDALMSFKPDPSNNELIPYFELMKARFASICPSFSSFKAQLPVVLPAPKNPFITYRSDASELTIDRLTKEAQTKWAADWDARTASQEARFKAISESHKKLLDNSEYCICNALADERHSAASICPSVKLYSR